MKDLTSLWTRFGLPKSRHKKRKESTLRKRQLLLERLTPRLMLAAEVLTDGQSGNGSTWWLDAPGGVESPSHLQAMGAGEGEGPAGDGPETCEELVEEEPE
jgi:hypothetical protein